MAVDLAIVVRGRRNPDDLARARHRVRAIAPSVGGFATGCATGALLEIHLGLWALALPVVLAAIAVPLGELWSNVPAPAPQTK